MSKNTKASLLTLATFTAAVLAAAGVAYYPSVAGAVLGSAACLIIVVGLWSMFREGL